MSDVSPTRAGRGMRVVLIFSLGLNLLVLGTIAGLALVGSGGRGDGPMPALRAVGLGPVLPLLSREDRAELADRLREHRPHLGEQGRPLGRAVRVFADALRSEPFDREVAAAALAAQRDHGAALQQSGHALLLDQIETMSAEERLELADRIERSLRRAVERRFDQDRGSD